MFYYAMQVETGRERAFVEGVRRADPGFEAEQALVYLTRELTIRRKGTLLRETRPLFPSYLFLQRGERITAQVVDALRRVRGFCRFLRSNADITPLAPADVSLLRHFMRLGPKVGASLVTFDENDRIVVVSGPLRGLEGSIIRVDRRRKRAKIRVAFDGSPMTVDLSFDVLEKGGPAPVRPNT